MSNRIAVKLNGIGYENGLLNKTDTIFLISPLAEQNQNGAIAAVCEETLTRVSFQTNKADKQKFMNVLNEVEETMSRKGGLLGQRKRVGMQGDIETVIPRSEVVGPDSLTLF